MIKGKWFASGSAKQYHATLHTANEQYEVEIANGERITGSLNDLKVEPRLGSLERDIHLEDGSIFKTPDNDQVDALLKAQNTGGFSLWLHRQETSLMRALLFAALTVTFIYFLFTAGVPWISKTVARTLPPEVNILIGNKLLEQLDEYVLEPSELNETEKAQIRQRFQRRLLPEVQDDITYSLNFRRLEMNDKAVPNAFALPSGEIIVTDQLISISNAQELDGILLHEMGHIKQRHGLQNVIQSSLASIMVILVFGDSDTLVDELITGVGSALLFSAYSRENEQQADQFAVEHMLKLNIEPKSLANILHRIDPETPSDDQAEGNQHKDTWLSTHPSTQSRAKLIQHYQKCFEQSLVTCPAPNN